MEAMYPVELLQSAANVSPKEIGLDSGIDSVNFLQLNNLIERLAEALKREGVRRGDIIVTRLPERFDYFFTLATWHLGAVNCSSHLPSYAELQNIAGFIVTNDPTGTKGFRSILVTEDWFKSALSQGRSVDYVRPNPSDLARLVLTSGTTGNRKLVPLSYSDLSIRVQARAKRRFSHGHEFSMYGPSTSGTAGAITLALHESKPYFLSGLETSFAGARSLFQKYEFTSLAGTPSQLLSFFEGALREGLNLSAVSEVRTAGTTPSKKLAKIVNDTVGVQLTIAYGSSETGVTNVKFGLDETSPTNVGPTVHGAELEIVNDDFEPIPMGMVGQIRCKTGSMVPGYYMADSPSFRDGWFYPGDLGFIDKDGNLHLSGRASERLNLSGIKIDPLTLDSKLKDVHGVEDVGTFQYVATSGKDTLGIALVTSTKDKTKDALIETIKRSVELRGGVEVFIVDVIPRNAMGKVDRLKLSSIQSA
ncbi:MAG: hypothetical protein RIR89_644 [Actinomycetota bacterium]|jgi:acyl-coenzyme A synthetase/AMP-(fatty) acid ligase